jgi:hypothetical protein
MGFFQPVEEPFGKFRRILARLGALLTVAQVWISAIHSKHTRKRAGFAITGLILAGHAIVPK